MNISSRCEYACRAMLELARHEQTGKPLSAQQIAEQRDIPEKYLVHILLQLKRYGLVKSVRGAQGGYILALPSNQISLHDIVVCIDGPILSPLPTKETGKSTIAEVWTEVAGDIERTLQKYTLASMMERVQEVPMYHI